MHRERFIIKRMMFLKMTKNTEKYGSNGMYKLA